MPSTESDKSQIWIYDLSYVGHQSIYCEHGTGCDKTLAFVSLTCDNMLYS